MYVDPLTFEPPQWSGHARRRLSLSLLFSSVCVATILLVLKFPAAGQAGTVTELLVQILVDEVESSLRPPPDLPPDEAVNDARQDTETLPARPDNRAEAPRTVSPPRDWYALIPGVAKAIVDAAANERSVNPAFDEKRRQASLNFAPGKAPRDSPIWENVEKDTLGRSVLRHGDCYIVVDDPNVGSREAFETFGQYMAKCDGVSNKPKELPWVSEIRRRREGQARSVPPAAE